MSLWSRWTDDFKHFWEGKAFCSPSQRQTAAFLSFNANFAGGGGLQGGRVRQAEIDTITVEIGGRDNITADEEAKLKELLAQATDPAFNIKIVPVKEIDWSENPKRLFFSSSVA